MPVSVNVRCDPSRVTELLTKVKVLPGLGQRSAETMRAAMEQPTPAPKLKKLMEGGDVPDADRRV